jgi:hypothetical protein
LIASLNQVAALLSMARLFLLLLHVPFQVGDSVIQVRRIAAGLPGLTVEPEGFIMALRI